MEREGRDPQGLVDTPPCSKSWKIPSVNYETPIKHDFLGKSNSVFNITTAGFWGRRFTFFLKPINIAMWIYFVIFLCNSNFCYLINSVFIECGAVDGYSKDEKWDNEMSKSFVIIQRVGLFALRQRVKQVDRQIDRQTYKQTDRQTDTGCTFSGEWRLSKAYVVVATTGAVLGRQNTSPNNLLPNMAANDFLQWNATLLSCSNSRVQIVHRSFDNIKHTERSSN